MRGQDRRLIDAVDHYEAYLHSQQRDEAINAAGSGIVTMFDADGKVIFTSDNKPVVKPAVGH